MKVILLELRLKGAAKPLRLTSAPFDVVYNKNTFQASGDLLKIGKAESSNTIITKGVEITLSGVDVSYQSIIDANGFLKAPLDLWMADLVDETNIITKASFYHRGYADTPNTVLDYKSGTATIVLQTQSVFQDLQKTPSLMRCTFATHKSRHNGDLFFQYVQDTPTEEIWRT